MNREIVKTDKYDCSELLQKYLPFFKQTASDERQKLCANTFITTYQKGVNIHGGDGTCTGPMVVLEGYVRAYLLTENGREVTLRIFGQGEWCMLASSCVIPSVNIDAVIDAESKCKVLSICGKVYAETAKQNIYAENFALAESIKLFSDMAQITRRMMMSIDKRVALFLLEESEKTNDHTIPVTHEKIAQHIGSAREVVSRMLKLFSEQGITELFRGEVKILDKQKLKQLAEK